MREIILDTETTGLDPTTGHRIIEIGCVEAKHHIPTGETYHVYIDPERDMPEEAFNVHGLSEDFLSGKPTFAEVVDGFLEFIGDAQLVIHNATFDMNFINAELKILGFPLLPMERSTDTVALARRAFPGAQASLEALCRRFDIDLSRREKHGALLDAELLAEVYLHLRGGRQPDLELTKNPMKSEGSEPLRRPLRPARPHSPSSEERADHAQLVDGLKEPIWLGGGD
ncbi:MAG TPA: DNA polymerase III subunit epsilon [Rhodospirillaceae bacterium]|nr:DNA polymerase III subunit epsilon [Rhodospirillaceae bacterium]